MGLVALTSDTVAVTAKLSTMAVTHMCAYQLQERYCDCYGGIVAVTIMGALWFSDKGALYYGSYCYGGTVIKALLQLLLWEYYSCHSYGGHCGCHCYQGIVAVAFLFKAIKMCTLGKNLLCLVQGLRGKFFVCKKKNVNVNTVLASSSYLLVWFKNSN